MQRVMNLPLTISAILLFGCWPTWYNLDSPGKRGLQSRNCLHLIGLWAHLWGIFLIDDWCRRAQLTVDGVPCGLVVLWYKKADQVSHEEQASQEHSSIPFASVPALSSCFDILSDGVWPGMSQPKKQPFPSQAAFGHSAYHSGRNLTRILSKHLSVLVFTVLT